MSVRRFARLASEAGAQGDATAIATKGQGDPRRRFVQVRQEITSDGDASCPAMAVARLAELRKKQFQGTLQMGEITRALGIVEMATTAHQ